jgi:hypothetical protein
MKEIDLSKLAEGDTFIQDGKMWEVIAQGIDWPSGETFGTLVKPVRRTSQQGNASQPKEKKQGTQHCQKEEKSKPKRVIRLPFFPKKPK